MIKIYNAITYAAYKRIYPPTIQKIMNNRWKCYLFAESLTTDISFECQAGAIRKSPFWLRATSQTRKKSLQRTNRLECARVGSAFERYRMIDSLAKWSLRFPRVFWSPAKRTATRTLCRMRVDSCSARPEINPLRCPKLLEKREETNTIFVPTLTI